MPTVVDQLGLERDAPFPGRSLARFWNPDRAAGRLLSEPLLMETGTPLHLANQGREPAAKGPMTSLIAWGMHYIRTAQGREELYLLKTDPQEQVNVAGSPMAGATLEGFRQILTSFSPGR